MKASKLVGIGVLALAGVFFSISAPAARTAPPQAAAAGIPGSVADQLAAQGMSLSPASTNPDDVPASQAIDTAVTTYAFLGGYADAAQAVRVRYTDPNYGTIVDDTTGAVAPFNVDKDAWLVLIPDTTNFIFGPPSYTGPLTYKATLAVFVDATTGDVIQAIAIADDVRALAVIATPAAPSLPRWLPGAEQQTLAAVFEGAKPIHIDTISYPRKVAVIFEFSHVVICGLCSAPSNALLPRGRIIRVGYDRETHRITGGYQFCESRGTSPPRASCLRR